MSSEIPLLFSIVIIIIIFSVNLYFVLYFFSPSLSSFFPWTILSVSRSSSPSCYHVSHIHNHSMITNSPKLVKYKQLLRAEYKGWPIADNPSLLYPPRVTNTYLTKYLTHIKHYVSHRSLPNKVKQGVSKVPMASWYPFYRMGTRNELHNRDDV